MLDTDPAKGLRTALKANAAFSAAAAAVLLIGDGLVAALFQAYSALGLIHLVGVGLAIFALFVFWLARRNPIDPKLARAVIGLDLLWVAGSAIAIAVGLTSGQGSELLAAVAAIVFIVALAQLQGLRRATAGGILIGR